jgi:Tol biopolymer transport system component
MFRWLFLLFVPFTASAGKVSVADDGHAYNPTWSPDGGLLAFELNRYGDAVDLFSVRVNNGVPAVPNKINIKSGGSSFSSGSSVLANPVWHPEGQLFFEGGVNGATNRLFYWSPKSASKPAQELLSQADAGGDLSWPTLSPNGQVVAFVSDQTGNGDIYLWDTRKNKVERAFTSAFSEGSPAYSPDGLTLAFSRKNRGTEDLFTWSGGASTKPLKGGDGDQSRPAFAGDLVVYFTSERGEGHWDIAVVNVDGSNRKILARDVRLPIRSKPALSPDKRSVLYASSQPEKGHLIFATSLDGSKTTEIDSGGLVACGEPAAVTVRGTTFLAYTALPSEGSDWRHLEIQDVTGKLP